MSPSLALLFADNLGIAVAYAAIGAEIVYFYETGRPIFRSRLGRVLFATFIPLCGLTHAVIAGNLWTGACVPSGFGLAMALGTETATSIVSLCTAALLPTIANEALADWMHERATLLAEIAALRQVGSDEGSKS